MTEIMELWNSPEQDQLYYRFGERFSTTRSRQQKDAESSLYGESYFYRTVTKEFDIPIYEDFRVISKTGVVLWTS